MSGSPIDQRDAVYVHGSDGRAEYRKSVLGFQSALAKRAQAVSTLLKAMLVVSVGVNVLQAASLFYAVPLIRVVPVFAWARPDGTVESAVTTASLPDTLSNAQRRAWLWQYVRLRETYNAVEADYNYNVVSGMSTPAVRAEYQEYANNKRPGVPSLAKILGRLGSVAVTFRDSEIEGDKFRVRFYRLVTEEGRPPTCTPWHASLSFGDLFVAPVVQRVTYNPGALVVTGYPGAEPEAAAPDISGLPAIQNCNHA